jgi:hypothetical protein
LSGEGLWNFRDREIVMHDLESALENACQIMRLSQKYLIEALEEWFEQCGPLVAAGCQCRRERSASFGYHSLIHLPVLCDQLERLFICMKPLASCRLTRVPVAMAFAKSRSARTAFQGQEEGPPYLKP